MTATDNIRAYRARKRAKDICIEGGCWEPSNGRWLCPRHREVERERETAWRLAHPVWRPCMEPGCPALLRAPNHLCAPHRQQHHRRQLDRNNERRRVTGSGARYSLAEKKRLQAKGICTWGGCGRPLEPVSKWLCPLHLAKQRTYR